MSRNKNSTQPASGETTPNEQNICPACDRGPDPIPILHELSETSVERIEEFVQVVAAFGGDNTPAEEFMLNLVFHHTRTPLTPEVALDLWSDFREHFDYAVDEALHIVKQYPERFGKTA